MNFKKFFIYIFKNIQNWYKITEHFSLESKKRKKLVLLNKNHVCPTLYRYRENHSYIYLFIYPIVFSILYFIFYMHLQSSFKYSELLGFQFLNLSEEELKNILLLTSLMGDIRDHFQMLILSFTFNTVLKGVI